MPSTRRVAIPSPRTWLCAVLFLVLSAGVLAQETRRQAPRRSRLDVTINEGRPIVAAPASVVIQGTTDAPEGSTVVVAIGNERQSVVADAQGNWSLRWPSSLPPGDYLVRVSVTAPDGSSGLGSQNLTVQAEAAAPAIVEPAPQEGLEPPPSATPQAVPEAPPAPASAPPAAKAAAAPSAAAAAAPASAAQQAPAGTKPYHDRWSLAPEPFGTVPPEVLEYEINSRASLLDPYNQNTLKGDRPVIGDRTFYVLGVVSDSQIEALELPFPSGLAAANAGSADFFGDDQAHAGSQNLALSFDLFRGDTNFRPVDWRLKATVIGNVNRLATNENALVNVDAREGTDRTDTFVALEECFFEKRLATTSANFDFISMRLGSQPFVSDFRGFILNDTNLGFRIFGNAKSNRYQFNLAYFDRLEKDTNSRLNKLEFRDQQVAVLNLFKQDFLVRGLTFSASVHHLLDEASFFFDENGFLARPDATGDATPHEIRATYLGVAGFGHMRRVNVDAAAYYVFGEDELNPIAGSQLVMTPDGFAFIDEVDISAYQLALELSWDKDWLRPKLAVFHASGDDDLNDRDAEGFDAIFDRPNFAGGIFSFWQRQRIPLTGTNVALVNRESLLPDLTSSKEEGQPNFVNPGVLIVSAGLDAEITPKLRGLATLNYIRLDHTEVLEGLLFRAGIDEEIGYDASIGLRFRPYLNQNFLVQGGVAALIPGDGFEDLYVRDEGLHHVFGNVTLAF
jgi:hypothetical protein